MEGFPMPLIPLDALSEGGLNVPVSEAPSYKDFSPLLILELLDTGTPFPAVSILMLYL